MNLLKKEKIKKFISSFLIIAFLVPSFLFLAPAPKAEAQFTDFVNAALTGIGNFFGFTGASAQVASTATQVKEFAKDILNETLKVIARRVLAEMTKSTVNWINSGFHGAPLFLENPSSFFEDIGKSEIKNLVSIIGYDSIRFPFGKDYLLNVINSYRRQLSDNLTYSMSAITNDPYELQRYRADFGYGGWDTFFVNTQYPQNNIFGFDILTSNDLAIRIAGTGQTAVQKVNTALEQGQGFLSPQVCRSNPELDRINPYNKPSFDLSSIPYNPPAPIYDEKDPWNFIPKNQDEISRYNSLYESSVAAARANFEMTNTCPEGYTTVTPGFLVAEKIVGAMRTPEEQASLKSVLGGSLTTIFDALLNKFIGDGLASLASRVNPGAEDNFNYYGATLGGSDSTTSWSGLPDEEVNLEEFKKQLNGKTVITDPDTGIVVQEDIGDTCALPTPPTYCATAGISNYVPGAIANTALEIRLIDNPTQNNQDPGLMQVIDSTWPVAQSLDMCIPGPNKGWEKKLDEEKDRLINTKLLKETGDEDALKVRAARDAVRELGFAINAFKDWISIKMVSSLPSAALFIDAVNELDTNAQQFKELTDKKRKKVVALARLNAIETNLRPMTIQPAPGSAEEKNLISLRKQYNSIAPDISNATGLETLQSELDLAKERKQNLLFLENQCQTERASAGWTGAGGANSVLPSFVGFPYKTQRWSAPSKSLVIENKSSNGSEKDFFCEVPASSGYSHGTVVRNDHSARLHNCPGGCNDPDYDTTGWFTFRSPHATSKPPGNDPGDLGLPGYQDLPFVNAGAYYGDMANGFPVSVDIDCDLLFRTNDNDYKNAGEASF